MQVLVTGLTGFIGAHVARYLLHEGHQVAGYELIPTPARIADLAGQVPLVIGDICDLDLLIATMKQYEITHVVHLAYYLPECAIKETPRRAIQVNCEGTNNVFEAARLLRIRKVVYASTDAVCPQGPNEDDPVKPTSLYGHMKYFNEVMARHYSSYFGLETVGLRFGVNYGPGGRLLAGETKRKYGLAFLHQILEGLMRGTTVHIDLHPQTTFGWQYVKDSARCVALALSAPSTARRVFNLVAPRRPIKDLTDMLERSVPGARPIYEPGENKDSGLLVLDSGLEIDPAIAREEFGYEAKYTLEAALAEYVTEEVSGRLR